MRPEIVLGPPGTGKTFSLLAIVDEELARGVSPDRIGYVSFTRRAADEAVTRAVDKFGLAREELPYFRTLHSLCFRHLGLSSADVLEGARLQEFADFAGIRVTGRWSEDGSMFGYEVGDRILHMEHLARTRCVSLREQYQEDDDGLLWHVVDRVCRSLSSFKAERALLDYTDMLHEFVRLGSRPRLEVLVVDEAQDLSQAQWRVVLALAEGCRRVVIAGDDDQAIYRWAGADVDFFVDMAGDVRVLQQSWRVPRAVQRVAASPVRAIGRRRDKEWLARDEEGEVARAAVLGRVDLSGDDVLILARNEYVLRDHVEPLLRKSGIVYEKRGHPSIKASLMEAIVLWEKLRGGGRVTGAEARQVYSHMVSRQQVAHGHKTLKGVRDDDEVDIYYLNQHGGLMTDAVWYEALGRAPSSEIQYILAARRRGESLRKKPRVRVSTIHGAKGGEADHVVLMREIAARTHREMQINPEDEARVAYVGITRARRRLTVVDSSTTRGLPWV